METKTLYSYNTIINNKIRRTVTLTRNELLGEFIGTSTRLVADPGKVLTDGKIQTTCIDTDEPFKWAEIDEPTPEEEPNE
jgi:hypothetical protein